MSGSAVLTLLWMASFASATQWQIPEGFKVVNNDAINNRVKNGDIIRYVWVEENYEFALVFLNTGPPSSFVPPNSTFYLSLITKPGGDPSLWNTVWSANRETPVKENATLALDSYGNLVLTDSDGTQKWSTQISDAATIATAQLDLSGNLQLLDSTNTTLWQSFDSPDDSLLPGQYLKSGRSLVAAVSTISSQGTDYSSGDYRMDALPGGLALTNGTSYYYIQSAETEEEHDISFVLFTCLQRRVLRQLFGARDQNRFLKEFSEGQRHCLRPWRPEPRLGCDLRAGADFRLHVSIRSHRSGRCRPLVPVRHSLSSLSSGRQRWRPGDVIL